MKYILLLFIGYSPKMNKKVIYAYQYLSNTETILMLFHISQYIFIKKRLIQRIAFFCGFHVHNRCNSLILFMASFISAIIGAI